MKKNAAHRRHAKMVRNIRSRKIAAARLEDVRHIRRSGTIGTIIGGVIMVAIFYFGLFPDLQK